MPQDLRPCCLETETERVAAAEAQVRWPCMAFASGCFVECLTEDDVRLHRLEEHSGLAFLQAHSTSQTRSQTLVLVYK